MAISNSENSLKKSKSSSKTVIMVMSLITLIAVAGFVWSYANYTKTKNKLAAATDPNTQQQLNKQEIESLVAKISKHMILPAGEEPTVASVTDADALKKEQPFYKDATNGDKLLVYMKEKKAIIYNVEMDLLVNVGPIYFNETASTTK